MLAVLFVILAAIVVLIAAPWNAPAQFSRITHSWLIALAGITQLPALLSTKSLFMPILGAGLVMLWTFGNLHIPGMWLLLLGVGANAIAMLQHGGMMPLDPHAATLLGREFPKTGPIPGSKDIIGNLQAWIWLGDWIIIRTPYLTLVGSPGDAVILSAMLYWAGACRMAVFERGCVRHKVANSIL